MVLGFNRWLLNFLMSGPFFDDKKPKYKANNTKANHKGQKKDNPGNVYETKMDYVNRVANFLEEGVREMKKDIKKL